MADKINISAERITLRAVEVEDIDFMYGLENDLRNWEISGTTLPFSRYILSRFIQVQQADIYSTKQLRLMIEINSGELIGTIDLFEFDPANSRAGVGIFIAEPYRGRGYGGDVLCTLHDYCRNRLHLHQLWCDIEADNTASRRLFSRCGYREVGVKREWLHRGDHYSDEILMQLIFE